MNFWERLFGISICRHKYSHEIGLAHAARAEVLGVKLSLYYDTTFHMCDECGVVFAPAEKRNVKRIERT